MTLGEEWYRGFWNQYQRYFATHQAQWDSTTADKKWSRYIFDFLTSLAAELGFQEKEEEPAFRARRFDRVWRREGDTVVLEHENGGIKAALDDEIRKLAQRKGDLHVCITYLPASEFPGYEYAESCKRVLDHEMYDSEFLLILGTYDMSSPTDWVCHRIFPDRTLKAEVLVLPSRKDRDHAERKGTRGESGWQALKRTYPSSEAVARKLREASRRHFKENYVRTLETLKRYWEKRGK